MDFLYKTKLYGPCAVWNISSSWSSVCNDGNMKGDCDNFVALQYKTDLGIIQGSKEPGSVRLSGRVGIEDIPIKQQNILLILQRLASGLWALLPKHGSDEVDLVLNQSVN